MSKDLILNELSLIQLAPDRFASRNWMDMFVDTILSAVKAGARRALRSTGPIDATLLTQGYSIAQWRNDAQVDLERRRYFRSLQSRAPFLDETDDAALLERNSRSQFQLGDQVAAGLGAALLLDALSISVTSEARWDCDKLSLRCMFLEDDAALVEEVHEVRHASRPAHVGGHADWLAGRDVPAKNGFDLWNRREELFPSLVFCLTVEQQLRGVAGGNPLLGQICKRLGALDRYFRGWSSGSFDQAQLPMKVTPESESTLGQFHEDRSFLCPDGEWRLFSWHVRMTPGAWRLYFEPDPVSRKAFIGYVGTKPPSVRYRT